MLGAHGFGARFVLIICVTSPTWVAAQTGPATATWNPVAAPAELTVPGAQWIKIDGRAGHKFLAAVFRPEGTGPFPVVVLLHGAIGLQRSHLALADEVARAGFVVVAGCWQLIASPPAAAPNPVCAEAPPQAQWQADPAANSGKELIAAARTLPGVRADRVGLYGLSRGGNAALWAASTGAVVQAIVADAAAHLPRVTPPPPSTQEAVAGLTAPTLLLHGTADSVSPVDQSREYERAARALGKPVTAEYFEGVGHVVTLVQPEARGRAIAFLREHLLTESQGQVDPFWLRSWNEAQEGRPLTMTSSGRIAEESEPGTPLIIHGQVFEPDGTSADGVVVHAYHRDRDGFDFGPNDDSLTTWRLQGWAETDAEGRFEFRTIRPAPDHLGREGAHIHFTLEANDYGRQWAPTVYLADDPLVSSDQRRRSKEAGEFGWVQEVETKNGGQQVHVRIRLKEEADF